MSSARKFFLFRMTRQTLLVADVAGTSVVLRWIDDKREHSGGETNQQCSSRVHSNTLKTRITELNLLARVVVARSQPPPAPTASPRAQP